VVTSSLKSTSEHELSLKKGVVQNESERAKREAEQVVFRERLKRIGFVLESPSTFPLCSIRN
jgi:hypothetical protein